MSYALIVLVTVTVFCLLLARWTPFLQSAIVLIAFAGVCLTLLGVLMPRHAWEGKYLFTVLGSYCLWFSGPFLVVWRGSVSAQVAWGWAIGLVVTAILGMAYVSWQMQSPFGFWNYFGLMGLTCLFGYVLANVAHSVGN